MQYAITLAVNKAELTGLQQKKCTDSALCTVVLNALQPRTACNEEVNSLLDNRESLETNIQYTAVIPSDRSD